MNDNKRYFLVDNSDYEFSIVDEITNIDHLATSPGKMSFYINGFGSDSQAIKDWFNEPCEKTILEISDNIDYPYDDRLPKYTGTAFFAEPTEDGFGTGIKGYSFSVDSIYCRDIVVYSDANNSMHYEDAGYDIKKMFAD